MNTNIDQGSDDFPKFFTFLRIRRNKSQHCSRVRAIMIISDIDLAEGSSSFLTSG